MLIQYGFVAVFVLSAVAYAVWLVVKAVRAANDPCHGCSGCAVREQFQRQQKKRIGRKAVCPDKK
ncbi:FeoB-associated Cys-rich membrane protein [Prevotella dentasini]